MPSIQVVLLLYVDVMSPLARLGLQADHLSSILDVVKEVTVCYVCMIHRTTPLVFKMS